MSDLRAAAQQALEALQWHYRQGHSNTLGGFRLKIDEKALRELSAALAQQAEPVQEPVAWAAVTENGKLYKAASTKKSAERKAEQQEAKFGDTWRPLHVVPLYTAPPQRKLVPLTEEEIERIGMKHVTLREVIRAVERAHGIGEQS